MELKPPIGYDKGVYTERYNRSISFEKSYIYLGNDITDVNAFNKTEGTGK